MSDRFIAHNPGTQDADTYRQFVELQRYLEQLEDRLIPSKGNVTYGTLVLDASWRLVPVLTAKLPPEPGVYASNVHMLVEGTSGTADVRFRWLSDTTPVSTGNVIDVSNNTLAISDTIYVNGSTDLRLQAKGNNASIVSGSVKLHRIGAAP